MVDQTKMQRPHIVCFICMFARLHFTSHIISGYCCFIIPVRSFEVRLQGIFVSVHDHAILVVFTGSNFCRFAMAPARGHETGSEGQSHEGKSKG